MTSDIVERNRAIVRLQDEARIHAANFKDFVRAVDAPTLKSAFDKSAELLIGCDRVINTLLEENAMLRDLIANNQPAAGVGRG